MGFFGSDSKTTKKTNITTNTTSTVRDIGLTGAHAVDLAHVLTMGNLETSRISAQSLDSLIQTVGTSAQQLIGGASELVTTQGAIAAGRESNPLIKLAPWIAVGAIAAIPLLKKF